VSFSPILLYFWGQLERERAKADNFKVGAALGARDDLASHRVFQDERAFAFRTSSIE
jgi:hypothetical protein